jgi:hypothetical protein
MNRGLEQLSADDMVLYIHGIGVSVLAVLVLPRLSSTVWRVRFDDDMIPNIPRKAERWDDRFSHAVWAVLDLQYCSTISLYR